MGGPPTTRTIRPAVSRAPAQPIGLARHEGRAIYSALDAMLKGALEADAEIELLAGPPRESFAALRAMARDESVTAILARHGLALLLTPDASRGVRLAAQRAVSGHRAIALVPNDEIDLAMPALRAARQGAYDRGGAMVLVLEDDPGSGSTACPRQAAVQLGMPCMEASGLGQLRGALEQAMRLSRAARGPAALVAHRWVLRSAQTLEARPNRVLDPVTAAVLRPRRHARWAEVGDVLRVARRLELNTMKTVPSPGEHLPVGFIVVGPAAEAIDHVVHVLKLLGRVPVLHLGLLNPVDEPVVQRMLSRCKEVVVLEPRPGSIEASVLRVAEAMRRRNEHAAAVTAHAGLGAHGEVPALHPDEALHPSILARKIVPLLLQIRPGLELPFVPDPPPLPAPPPPRGRALGDAGAASHVRQALAEVDQWLRDRAAGESAPGEEADESATALAIDGAEPAEPAGGRPMTVEIWTARRLLSEGIASLRQAAWGERPWMFVVCALGEDAGELERLSRAAIPAERSEGARVESVDISDANRLRELLRELATARLSVVIVHDGPPPRFDVRGLEEQLAEVDRLGYEPRQLLAQTPDAVCTIRPAPDAAEPAVSEPEREPMRAGVAAGGVTRAPAGFRVRLRPLLETIEVVRDRPPASPWRGVAAARLELPRPLHATQPEWRAHLAGFRGDAPGVAARVLCEAGRAMGYEVGCLYDPAPIGPGRRAWSQVLFMRSSGRPGPLPVTSRIPYGEADLLLGLDAAEVLRAIDPAGALRVANHDRTHAACNLGAFAGEPPADEQSAAAIRATSREQPRLLEDFTSAARAVFHTDRVTDLAVLGAAFQLGLVPLSHDAIEDAVARVEGQGFGRSAEAFRFGRQLGSDQKMFARPRSARAEGVDRLARPLNLLLRCGRFGWRAVAPRFADLVEGTLGAMPGLGETDAGRQAERDLVMALHRCLAWGGFEYARRYAGLVEDLYRADRGDTGRALTRHAILPLAEAMLIRDPFYLATLVTSAGHHLAARRRLNVRLARGDRVQRRFLLNLELAGFRRRLRLEVRTSDWLAWVAAVARRRLPLRFRGTRRERQIRDLVAEVVAQAARDGPQDYARWTETLQRLHVQAVDDRLRGMAVAELRMLIAK